MPKYTRERNEMPQEIALISPSELFLEILVQIIPVEYLMLSSQQCL